VSVAAVADRPVANDDIASTDEDSPTDIHVTANDTDVDGDLVPVAVQIVVPPADGNATVAPDGTVRYRPNLNFHGRDRFEYRVCDAGGRCDRASVTVSVAAVGDRPVADDDTASTDEDEPIGIRVTANDTDVDGDLDRGSVVVVRKPAHGRAVVIGGGAIRYRPDPNFHGQDRFDYRVCDARPACVTASVTVTIRPVNDVPDAVSDVVIVVRAGNVTIDVLANDSDVDGPTELEPTSVAIVAGPSLGTARVNATSGAIEYTASPGTDGTDRLTYVVCDLGGQCATAELEIRIDLPPTPPPGTLPRTGSNFGGHAGAAALAAVGVGALLFTASRRTSLLRRRPSN
jgi:hypothetical protein